MGFNLRETYYRVSKKFAVIRRTQNTFSEYIYLMYRVFASIYLLILIVLDFHSWAEKTYWTCIVWSHGKKFWTVKTQEGVHCSVLSNRARYNVIEFSNCSKEERSEAEFICAVWKWNNFIPCSITEQSTTSYVLTVLEHSQIQNDVIACTFLW